MKWLSDQVVDQLRSAIELPDLSGSRYRPVKLLGRGGMGAVWLAEDSALNRQVALKILELADEHGALSARLTREAEILASLEHPGIVPIHDAGTLRDGSVFYCMKYVRGLRLDEHAGSLTSVTDQLRLIQRIAEPIAFAHSKAVLHRDLKPANIMIGPFGEVLVMDWGLAKRSRNPGAAASPAAIAQPDRKPPITGVVGTPGFMSPEQARGEAVDVRSDIFSLGAVMSFVLSATNPSDANRADSRPRPLAAICAKAMAPDPASRYHSVDEFSADISRYLDQQPVSAYPETIFDRMARLTRRHGAALALVMAYLLMRLLFILFARH